jgi:hypothetical protein
MTYLERKEIERGAAEKIHLALISTTSAPTYVVTDYSIVDIIPPVKHRGTPTVKVRSRLKRDKWVSRRQQHSVLYK